MSAAAYGPTLAGQAAGSGLTSATLIAAYPLSAYGGATDALAPIRGTIAQGTDFIFACQSLNVSKRLLAQTSPIWMYEFRDQTALASIGVDASGAATVSTPQGAAHSYELQYLFNLRDLQNEERRALQTTIATYWTNFARTGSPNNGSTMAIVWPTFTGNGASDVLGLDVAAGGGVKVLSTSFDTAHKCSTLFNMLTF
jgi:para-nitrobenzyl esterase